MFDDISQLHPNAGTGLFRGNKPHPAAFSGIDAIGGVGSAAGL